MALSTSKDTAHVYLDKSLAERLDHHSLLFQACTDIFQGSEVDLKGCGLSTTNDAIDGNGQF